ncbi:3-deoxy-D-manno-octulosonate 8-phosphate phosphatase (KDO 8-P phosphatase) [Cyclobacterium lianum]|uniref:3-deoxy-D-manno-octulosonate 8-phosphate phosphatase (KDO 8-P phosphatase) n=1 Tax=Cyclobacterium lianum TaxID=388280 RepID=A0A1M7QCZ9_9BACT|nr:HAD hydrolase family protein [Cyclobacterium lianum]SHN28650.1 3-deoxy-D-manno-octulosonate 8-phosphate phosphatase (KDO 8-P phosphatase) [Cyclobacterium lianum]
MDPFEQIPSALLEKAKQIRLLVSDLDGVLTDGGIILDDQGTEYKKFQVKDGQIISYLKQAGIQTGILSGRNVKVSQIRCEQMAVDFHYHGVRDKWATLKEIIDKKQLPASGVAYIGDDLIDAELLSKVGLSAAPADAISYIRSSVDFVTNQKGGKGAFRELADLILFSQEKLPFAQVQSKKTY